MKDLKKRSNSHTVRYLLGEEEIPVPAHRRPWNNYIELKGARENNLKGVNVRFPLNVMTVVTGVSGSGKSTLVRDIFYRALKRELDECSDRPGRVLIYRGQFARPTECRVCRSESDRQILPFQPRDLYQGLR